MSEQASMSMTQHMSEQSSLKSVLAHPRLTLLEALALAVGRAAREPEAGRDLHGDGEHRKRATGTSLPHESIAHVCRHAYKRAACSPVNNTQRATCSLNHDKSY